MRFYNNTYQFEYNTISILENNKRLVDIVEYLNRINKIIKIDAFNYNILFSQLPAICQNYIKKTLDNIKKIKLVNCKICSWNNEKEYGKIICEICDFDISNVKNRYGYMNSESTDTSIHENTIQTLENMLSCIQSMVNTNVINGFLQNDIMLITRPPGHHSSIDSIEGFCYLNWAYITSSYFNSYNKKVCVIDLDLHHGNGTQTMVKDNDLILFIDFHYYDAMFYPKTGNESVFISENVINVNMKRGSDDQIYISKIKDKYEEISMFEPDVFIISMGCDIIDGDSFDIMKCSNSFYKKVYDNLSEKFQKKIIFILEGGYNADNITNTIKEFV